MKSKLFFIIVLALLNFAACGADCNCGDYCSACQSQTSKYIQATLSNIQGCPADFHQGVSQAYPCFTGGTMDIVLQQDELNSCGYYYNGPTFTIEDASFEFRLCFYLSLGASSTDFSIIVQENCGEWYDLYWITTSISQSCGLTGSSEFSSLCNAPFPDIESGTASWQPMLLADGNCPDCGDANDSNGLNENCGELTCENLDQYALISGSNATYYYGPFLVCSPPECEKNAKTGNAIQTAKIVCPGAQLVSATAQSSSPDDIIVSAINDGCQSGSSATFSINALRGKGRVTLNATFYEKVYADECVAKQTTKTITILVQPDNGDGCCGNQYKPVLLKGSPGNVSTPIRAGVNPLNEWPSVNIYEANECFDIEAIVPGRFTPVIFNNGNAPEYMRGWNAQISESNAIIITNPENLKYIYDTTTNYKIHLIANAQNRNIVEFIYDSNGLPLWQNDLTDANLYISYHYNNGLLTEIREHAGETYRQFIIEYDNERVSFVGGGCSQCGTKNSTKYFYNADGSLQYEKNINNEIIYEYTFDSQDRLTEKWLGVKTANHPVSIINYTDDVNGYAADIKNYADDDNYYASREYYSKAQILTERTTCERFNEDINCPAGGIFTEEYIYDINETTGRCNKLTVLKPKTNSAKTEYTYDSNCGELVSEKVYDSNNCPITLLENIFESSNSNVRITQSTDAYNAHTYYQYADGSNYPSQIVLPGGQKQVFLYDAEKQVVTHSYFDNDSNMLSTEIDYDYDAFGNLTEEKHSDGNDINDVTEYRYNDFGEAVRIVSPQGLVTGKSYDNLGRLVSEYTLADANDIAVNEPDVVSQKNYTYNSNGLLAAESIAVDSGRFEFDCPTENIFTKYEYDQYGRLIKIIEDANGTALETQMEYDRQDEITKIAKPGNVWVQYIYDGRGLLISEITGRDSNDIIITEYQYDQNGNCVQQTDAGGTTSILQYDEFDRIKRHYLPSGAYAVYSYNSASQVISQTLYDVNNIAMQQTVYEYDDAGRCGSVRQRQQCGIDNDTDDFVTVYSFDCFDNVIQKTIKAETEANDIALQYQFDGKSRLTKIIDAMSNSKKFAYDKDDNLKSITNELNLTSVNTYDGLGRLAKTQTPSGIYKTFIYDSLDRCINETLHDANNTPIEQKRFEYDGLGNTVKTITMRNAANTNDSNSCADSTVVYGTNDAGQIESSTIFYNSDKQAVEHYQYDSIGRLSKITDAIGNIAEILYDTNIPGRISGQLLTLTDGNEYRHIPTSLKYDQAGRIIESRIDSNLVTQFVYDGADRVTKQIKPSGLEIAYEYDSFDNVIKITKGSSVVDYEYDRTGRLTSATACDDANGQQTKFEYDKNAQVTKIIFADGSTEKFKYDATGKAIEKTLRSNDKIYFGYDSEDNLVWQSDDPNGNPDNADFLVEFEYNPNGLITYAGKAVNGQTVCLSEFEYNCLGRVIRESTSLFGLEPVVIEYEYDQAGNITSQIADWSRLNFAHDGLGRITNISRNDSNLAQVEYLGSTVSKMIYFEAGIEYTADFDAIGRINRCKSVNATETLLDYVYSYGNGRQRTSCAYNHLSGSPADVYEYDAYDRVSKATYADGQDEEFAYDLLGNRTQAQTKDNFTETYYHNNLNQYTKLYTNCNFFSFGWDADLYWDDNGRLSSETIDALQYEYDKPGNLIRAEVSGETVAEFVYDALGRRIRKTTSDDDIIYYYDLNNRIAAEYKINNTSQPVFTSEYIYGNDFADCIARFTPEITIDSNGLMLLAEFCNTYLFDQNQPGYDSQYDYDNSGLVDLKDFSGFAAENQISVASGSNDETRWYYIKDALGSVAGIIGGKYNRLAEREFFCYDVFGRPNQTSGTGSEFMFAGMIYDSQIEKYYCVNRYYDADIGIFLSTDPMLFSDGYNPYEYARNNPVMLTDRLGLKSSLVEEIKFLIGKGQIRTAAERLTQEVKKTCDKIDSDCKSRKCVAGVVNPNCNKSEKCYKLYRRAMEYDKNLNSECAKAAAIGAMAGTAQGLLNTVNGVQDAAVSTGNLGLGIWNSSGALICDKELEYIDSPDWSKDVIVKESATAHEISKFLGGQGAVTVMTAGASSGQAVKKAAQEGIYEFTAASGKTYVGQSSNIPRRIIQHIKSGKLPSNNAKAVKTTQVTGGKLAREIAEQTRIDRLGGIKNLENVRNAIGPARSYLLKK